MGESFRGSDQGVGSMVGGGGGEGEDGVDVWVKEGVNDGGSSRLEGSMTTMNVALVVAPGRRCRNNSKWYYWMAQRWREQTEGQEAQRRWSVHGRTGRGRGRGRERGREGEREGGEKHSGGDAAKGARRSSILSLPLRLLRSSTGQSAGFCSRFSAFWGVNTTYGLDLLRSAEKIISSCQLSGNGIHPEHS